MGVDIDRESVMERGRMMGGRKGEKERRWRERLIKKKGVAERGRERRTERERTKVRGRERKR